jgi:hypothetical protein
MNESDRPETTELDALIEKIVGGANGEDQQLRALHAALVAALELAFVRRDLRLGAAWIRQSGDSVRNREMDWADSNVAAVDSELLERVRFIA